MNPSEINYDCETFTTTLHVLSLTHLAKTEGIGKIVNNQSANQGQVDKKAETFAMLKDCR